ncbi:MAG: HAD hydrolase family protein, partial [Candidatus Heimdallarchaeaceae archaeon]
MDKMYLRVHFKEASFSICSLSENDNITRIIEILENECHKNKWDLKFIEPSRTFVEIGIANKAEAVKYLSNYLNIPLKNVCAIGDAENDIEMLKL